MIYLPAILPFAAAAIMAVLGARSLYAGKMNTQRLFFALSCLAVAVSSLSLGLLMFSKSPGAAFAAVRSLLASSFAAAAFIIPYFISAGKKKLA
jgi:hypothetical protein